MKLRLRLPVSALTFAALLGSAAAENPVPTANDPKPVRGTRPPPPAVVFPAVSPMIELHLPFVSWSELLSYYGLLIEKKIVQDGLIAGNTKLEIPGPVTRTKAAELIAEKFFAEGFSLVDTAPDTVLAMGLSKNARGAGIPVLTKREELPEQLRVVTFVFRFQHRNPAEIQNLFQRYAPPHLYSNFLLDPASRTLAVTESSRVIRSLLRYAEELDVPAAKAAE